MAMIGQYSHDKDMEYFHLQTFETYFKSLLRQWYKSLGKEKANAMPIYQTLKNWHLVSRLSTCSKIFERLLFNEMLGLFLDKVLISTNQSDFKPGYSCINQLYQ